MATLLSVERLEGIRIPTEQEEHQRFLTRTRQQLIEDRTAAKNKIRMKCHQVGLIHPEDKREMSYKLRRVQLSTKECGSLRDRDL